MTKQAMNEVRLSSSFRDPGGFLFKKDGELFRQINLQYKADYEALMGTGLYAELVKRELLVPHEEVSVVGKEAVGKGLLPDKNQAYKLLKPTLLPFLSYPYEWCFSQYKQAALLTLEIQKTALKHRMILKDASAYNIQFVQGRPIFIDLLSFQKYDEGEPWDGYRQFCQHFLVPLLLMSYVHPRLNCLMQNWIDGIPIELCQKMLPAQAWINPGVIMHIGLQAAMHDKPIPIKSMSKAKVSMNGLCGITDSLIDTTEKLSLKAASSDWPKYYEENDSYTARALESKEKIVKAWLARLKFTSCWDLGSNTGRFSLLASEYALTIAFDQDAYSVEANYKQSLKKKNTRLLPLVLDLANPSPSIGWANSERLSLMERGPCDLVLALALLHHLAISNNVPFRNIASFLSSICRLLIIEFVPKQDEKVEQILRLREDVFPDYTPQAFEREFGEQFSILEMASIVDSQRALYLMELRLPLP
jgi:SAM-dependent methyltransferase